MCPMKAQLNYRTEVVSGKEFSYWYDPRAAMIRLSAIPVADMKSDCANLYEAVANVHQ